MDAPSKWHSYSVNKAVFVGVSAMIGCLLMIYLSEAMRFGDAAPSDHASRGVDRKNRG